jgi:hypothetical protein
VADELPDDVRRFLIGAIPSVPHLEALLLLREEPGDWTAAAVARRIYVSTERAALLLRDLGQQRLLVQRGDTFQYGPEDDRLKATIERLAALYARHVVDIARLLHAKLDTSAEEFSKAFRLRKDP